MSQFPAWAAGQKVTAALLREMTALYAVKASNQTVTNSTTLVNDNDLVVPVEANATYEYTMFLRYGAHTSGNLKWLLSGPSGYSGHFGGYFLPLGSTGTAGQVYYGSTSITANGAADGSTTDNTTILIAQVHGLLVTSSTAGNAQLQWAQNTSFATGTILYPNSHLMLRRIA